MKEVRYDGFVFVFGEDGQGTITVYHEDTGEFVKILQYHDEADRNLNKK